MAHPQLYHNNTRAPVLAPISKAKKHLKQYDEALPMLLKALEANGECVAVVDVDCEHKSFSC